MACIARIDELASEFTQIRRQFHAHPELSNKEFETSKTIARYLSEWGIEVHTGIGGTGVVGVLKNGDSNKRIALRADIDALPITEANRFAHASQNKGSLSLGNQKLRRHHYFCFPTGRRRWLRRSAHDC